MLRDDFDAPWGMLRIYHWPGGELHVRLYI